MSIIDKEGNVPVTREVGTTPGEVVGAVRRSDVPLGASSEYGMLPLEVGSLDVLQSHDRLLLSRVAARDPNALGALIQLGRILQSKTFSRVKEGTKDFLRYVVALRLVGRQDRVKESTIAMAVFGESADFDPLQVSKVRVAGSALRQRLAEYYLQEGRCDPIRISLPVGTYVPDIRDQRVTMLVEKVVNWAPKRDRRIAGAILGEVCRLLTGVACLKCTEVNVGRHQRTMQHRLRCSVETTADSVKMNVSLMDASVDSIVLSRALEVCRDDMFRLPTQVVSVIVDALGGRHGALSDEDRPSSF